MEKNAGETPENVANEDVVTETTPDISEGIAVISFSPYVAAGTSTGLVREGNEDSYLCEPERELYIVADGMGGHAAGEVASETVITSLNETLTKDLLRHALESGVEALQELLTQSIQQANEAVVERAAQNWALQGMGSTVALALRNEGKLYVANVGDSRVYLVRDGRAMVISQDHSVAAILLQKGQISPEEVRDHPMRNQLTMALGSNDRPLAPAFRPEDLLPGDRVVICSDGLWDMVSDKDITRLTEAAPDAATAVNNLILAAHQAGGHDNITVIIAIEADMTDEGFATDGIDDNESM